MAITDTPRQQTYKLAISGFLFFWTLSVFLPGAYSIDTWNQWNEVATGRYDDWYGTGLATTWKWLWYFTGNYMCLYVFQTILYWSFVTILLWRVPLKSVGYWGMVAFSLFFIFIPQYIMRDSLSVLAWGLGAALLLVAGRNSEYRRRATILGLLLLAYGLWVRINMIAALLPLVYIGIYMLGGQRLSIWKRVGLTVVTCFLVLGAVQIWTYDFQKARHTYPDYKLKLLDLTGITKLSGELQFPPEVVHRQDFHLDTLMAKYTPASIDDIYWPPDLNHPIFPYPSDSFYILVSRSWRHAIVRHPLYYLENRLTGFLYYLHIKKRFSWGEYWDVATFWVQPDGPLPAKVEWTPLKKGIGKVYGLFTHTPFYDPWFWLLLNILGFGLFTRYTLRRPRNEQLFWLIHACIQLSGVLFILSQALVYQHDRDFRYTYWSCFVVLFALAALSAKSRKPDEHPAP